MSPLEVALHARRKLVQVKLANQRWTARGSDPGDGRTFPAIPDPREAPPSLREALGREVEEILAGRWKAFGQLTLQVDTPPRWQRDYLAEVDLSTAAAAFGLNHRELPGGADIKLVWELSRWNQLVRLAMARHVLSDVGAGKACVSWLEDWVANNPPYRGWNWTSALEVGIRLIQFAWIDALLSQDRTDTEMNRRLMSLRSALLPPHVSYAWHHRSFGSSANNHLLGELAGCVVAVVRWPALARFGATLQTLAAIWEREVLAQFAEDGGNREQALNYHLFGLELCWQAALALERSGSGVSPAVMQRLGAAARFYRDVQVPDDPWDYGDSDDAFVTPVFAEHPVREWHEWIATQPDDSVVGYWLGSPPADGPANPSAARRDWPGGWIFWPQSGMAVQHRGPCTCRWDLSPLGYLATAAHGHLDALHLSLWIGGTALIVDPGTGAYYGDRQLRAWLASRPAHNGPCPSDAQFPSQIGTFLWASHHDRPRVACEDDGLTGTLELPSHRVTRRLACPEPKTWKVADTCTTRDGAAATFTVSWQFAPGTSLRPVGDRAFLAERAGVRLHIALSGSWGEVTLMDGLVSPGFRLRAHGPLLKLESGAGSHSESRFVTTFSLVEHE